MTEPKLTDKKPTMPKTRTSPDGSETLDAGVEAYTRRLYGLPPLPELRRRGGSGREEPGGWRPRGRGVSEQREASRTPMRWGIALTIIWAAALCIYIVPQGFAAIWSLPPNEFGDFLAGAFAPPALLWIVIGYFQQKEELAIQVEQLRASVRASEELAREARDQRTRDIAEAQPRLSAQLGMKVGDTMRSIAIWNHGADATKLRIGDQVGELRLQELWSHPLLVRGRHIDVSVRVDEPGLGSIRYLDNHGNDCEFWFRYDGETIVESSRAQAEAHGEGGGE